MKRLFAAFLAVCLIASMPAMADEQYSVENDSTEFSVDLAEYISSLQEYDKDVTAFHITTQGYEILRQVNYGNPVTDRSHIAAYTVAKGTPILIRGVERNIILVSIRGTGDGEWYSNFDFAYQTQGDCVFAENFMTAAQAIFDDIKPDIEATEKPVIIVTGYSRGAACANLLGVLLDDEYGYRDVYVYTFATPATVRGEIGEYPNIFNIVNADDAVTQMPPKQWGFYRAGQDIVLDDPEVTSAEISQLFLMLLGICPNIDSYYNDLHSLTETGLSDNGVSLFTVMTYITDIMSGDPDLSLQAQQKLQAVVSAPNDLQMFIMYFVSLIQPSDVEGASMKLFEQHMPYLYTELFQKYANNIDK